MALFFYKEKNKDIRAAAYLRLSIEDGDKAESNSIGNQRELIRDFAAERPGLHLVEEYADDGYTGTNFERPGFKRMMEDIKSGKINCIIVKDLSRLGRNYIEMGKYLEQIFPMMGIRFIAINDNYDNANTESSDSDSIVVPFKNLLNDSYCRDISIKVRSQLDMKRRKGEFIGGYAIYGYCKDKRNKNRLVVDEYAADIVRSIYRRKLEGMSAQAIAEQLNSENVLAPSEYKRLCGLNYHSGFKAGTHAKWQAIQVLRILKNEVYTGTMVQGRRQKINYKIKKIRDVEESGWIRVPNMHEAIIPQKLFDTVQEVLKLDTCASKGQQAVNLFSGIVRCGGCGQNMVRRTVSKNGKKYIYLHCVTNHNGLGCSSHLISESKLAEVVLAALQGKVQQISGLEHRLDEINEIPKNERRLKSVEEHLKMLEQEEQKYQTLRRQLYEDMSSGIVSKEEYKEFSHSFNEKVEAIRKAKAEMNRQRDCLNNLDVEHLPWIEDGEKMPEETLLLVEDYIDGKLHVFDKDWPELPFAHREHIGCTVDYVAGRNRYMGYLISLGIYSFKGVKVGLDCANGSSWNIAKSVFDALGADTYVINNNPNGLNINNNAGSTHIKGLQKFVVEKGLDVGFAYDGDADRCLCVDEKGNVITGDHILYIYGCYMKERGKLLNNTVVTTVMSNFGLYKAFDEKGIGYAKTAVGDKYVYEYMAKNGCRIGGEQSGHIIFSKYASTGDGILTSLKMMEVILEQILIVRLFRK